MTLNKTFLKCIACLLILVFHLWMPVSGTEIEYFIVRCAYIGVDIFFLVSAYSLADKKLEFKTFILNRFKNIYLKFVLFALIAALYKSWSINKLIRVILLIELVNMGGGSFLWFLPAIMFFYILYPLFINWDNKYKGLIVLLITLLIGFILTYFNTYTTLLIILNRIPVFLLGYYLKKSNIKTNLLVEILLFTVGLYLTYKFAYKFKLNNPIKDLYYIAVVPLVLSISLLSKYIKNNKVISFISNITLECYALQMIIGFDIAQKVYRLINIKLVSNLITLIAVLLISYLVKLILDKLYKLIKLS